MIENVMLEYEAQLAAKDQEINRMKKVRTGPIPHVVPPVTSDEAKLEMSLVTRTAEITQLTADKNLLVHELQELQTKFKFLVTEKDAATHQVEIVTHQWRTAQKMSDLMEEKNRTLTKKLQRMEREKEGSLLEQQQKERIKQLEDQLRGMAAEKQASEDALRKQAQSNQEHIEQLLQDAHAKIKLSHTKEDEDKQLRQELLNVQSQLQDSTAKITALEKTKQKLQMQLDEGKKTWETELRDKLQKEKAQSHTTQQQLRQELETLQREQQQLLMSKEYEIQELAEKLKRKREKCDAKVEKMRKEMETLQQKTRDDAIHATRQQVEMDYRIKQSELQENFVLIQQILAAEREKVRRIVDEYNTKVAELQQQIEALQATANKEEWVSGTECSFAIKLAPRNFMYLHGVSPTLTTAYWKGNCVCLSLCLGVHALRAYGCLCVCILSVTMILVRTKSWRVQYRHSFVV